MYEEGKKHLHINWGSLIIKLLIFAFVVFLAGWLFIKLTNNKKTNTKKPMANTEEVTESKDTFNENIEKMKDVALNYFVKSRLPEKYGSTEKLTLGEMIDKKLLLDFTNNGETCDLDESYIQATRSVEDNYAIKVNLTCGKKSDYIRATIAKEDICANITCTKTDNSKNDNVVADSSTNNNSSSNSSSSSSSSSNSSKKNTSSSSSTKKSTVTTTTTTTVTVKVKCINGCCPAICCCNSSCKTNCTVKCDTNNTTNNNNNSSNNTTNTTPKKVRYYEYMKWSEWKDGYSYHSKAENKKVDSKWQYRIPEYEWSKETSLAGYTKTGNYEDRDA